MFTITSKLGPKGQVVIPKVFRDALKIGPGSEVSLSSDGDRVIIEPPSSEDPLLVFERIAKKGRRAGRIRPHDAYEEELEERLG